jgi:uncharacterized protein (DUF1697 family)
MVGRKGLTQAVLVDAFERSGGQDVASVLATGNIVFSATDEAAVASEASLWLRTNFGLDEPMFVRSFEHLRDVEASKPFASAPSVNVYEQCISFARTGLSAVGELPVESKRRDVCVFQIVANDAFSVTRMIGSRCGTAGPMLEKLSGQRVTTRNWKTVLRLLDKEA